MAMDVAACKATIKAAILANYGGSPTSEQQSKADDLAGAIANSVVTLIGTATVNVTTGVTSPSGPVTGVIAPGSIV